MNSNHGSKKRPFDNGGSNNRQADEAQLFGTNPIQDDAEAGFSQARPTANFGGDFEAQEDDDFNEESKHNTSEEDEGEDLMLDADNDYQKIDQLDRYEERGLDDDEQDELSHHGRAEVENQLAQRDRQQPRGGRQAAAFMDEDEDSQDQDMRAMRRQMMQGGNEYEYEGNEGMNGYEDVNDYSEPKGPISQWIQRNEVKMFIRKKFSAFLRTFKDKNEHHVYEDRIHAMCQHNKQSIEVNFTHLSNKQPTLAIWLAEEPAIMLPILNEVANDTVLEVYPDYSNIHDQVFVRVRDLPVEDKLRDLRQVHLNALIKFKGVVTKRTGVFPQFSKMFFRCICGDLKGPTYHNTVFEGKQYLGKCILCQKDGPYTLDQQFTIYRNYQKLTVQETPGSVPPGRVPRQKEVTCLADLVDSARPGDEVEITGIYINRFDYIQNVRHGFPVFQTFVEANNVKRQGDEDIIELTDEDKQSIRKMSKRDGIATDIINSIAPSIYGHTFIKKALCLAMFGGESKDINGKHRIRGDINVLLLGDPGTAKSQFLKYIEQLYPRVVYTTGKGASAVGLTAGVHKDPITGEWTLEGGALVLADKGLCLIDEFDKMNENDRTSIHEAMEQQTISISKAGIVTQLQARCSVVAAANPIGGIYRIDRNFNDNVELTDPILSRFDILTVIKDIAEPEHDDMLATFVINSHMKNHPGQRTADPAKLLQNQTHLEQNLLDESNIKKPNQENLLRMDELRKYIIYAKKHVHPRLNEIDKEKITNFYAKIRQESSAVGGIPIAVRHIESVLRMSEAHAKMHLREYVRPDDIDFAINMLLDSFLQTQKSSVARALSKKFEPFKQKQSDQNALLIHLLRKQANERAIYMKYQKGVEESERLRVEIPLTHFQQEAADFQVSTIQGFFTSQEFMKEFSIEGQQIRTVMEI